MFNNRKVLFGTLSGRTGMDPATGGGARPESRVRPPRRGGRTMAKSSLTVAKRLLHLFSPPPPIILDDGRCGIFDDVVFGGFPFGF